MPCGLAWWAVFGLLIRCADSSQIWIWGANTSLPLLVNSSIWRLWCYLFISLMLRMAHWRWTCRSMSSWLTSLAHIVGVLYFCKVASVQCLMILDWSVCLDSMSYSLGHFDCNKSEDEKFQQSCDHWAVTVCFVSIWSLSPSLTDRSQICTKTIHCEPPTMIAFHEK